MSEHPQSFALIGECRLDESRRRLASLRKDPRVSLTVLAADSARIEIERWHGWGIARKQG